MMLTIVWDPNGFHLIDAMPKGEMHSARHHVNNILTSICQRLILAGKRKLAIHPDNSRCHTAKVVLDFVSQRKARFVPHPPDSPDITPSDFFLFVALKRELRVSRFQTAEELPAKVRKLVSEISSETLLEVFHDWIARCENVIVIHGNCCE
jgi:histone-lysine N-methyltransferase SETMAR